MTVLRLADNTDTDSRYDALVVGVVSAPDGPQLAPGSVPVDGATQRVLRRRGVTGQPGEVQVLGILGGQHEPVVVTAGLGARPDEGAGYDSEVLRQAAGAAVRALAGTPTVVLSLPVDGPAAIRAVAEGALLGGYAFARYRTVSTRDIKPPVRVATLLVEDAADAQARAALRRAEIVAAAVSLARDLVNTPPSDLRPADLADIARRQCGGPDVTVEILDEQALRAGGFGGIVGVGQGSHHPPRLVHLSYRPHRSATAAVATAAAAAGLATPTVALVGKGITFDSGGISLKSPAGMHEMKMDMAGAAAVIATVCAVAQLRLAIAVEAWVPVAENMPGGGAIRPSDVLTMRNGLRVEVVNTDTEGRLILGDAIARACEDDPDIVVDIATLTSAQMIALGRVTGVMANDDALRADVLDAADRAGEPAWGMPLPQYLRAELDSPIADFTNHGPRHGGMLAAGLFLREFVASGVRWAHLDIAGPAYHPADPYGYTPKGGTGAGVRMLVQLIEDLAGGVPIMGR